MKCTECGCEILKNFQCDKCKRVLEQAIFHDILSANRKCRELLWISYQITYNTKGYTIKEIEGY